MPARSYHCSCLLDDEEDEEEEEEEEEEDERLYLLSKTHEAIANDRGKTTALSVLPTQTTGRRRRRRRGVRGLLQKRPNLKVLDCRRQSAALAVFRS